MGMSIPYAIERRFAKGFSGEYTLGHILSRTLALVLMGVFIVNSEHDFTSTAGYGLDMYRLLMAAGFFLVWNQYGAENKVKKWLRALGVAILAFLAFTYRTPDGGYMQARWWGILGIIGWTYCFCAVAYLLLRKKPLRMVFVWAALCMLNLLVTRMRGGEQILPGATMLSDLAGVLKLGNGCFAVMAVGGMLLSLAENRLDSISAGLRAGYAACLAVTLAVAGVALHHWWTISKLLGTLPWCLYVASISVCLYAVLRIMEARAWTGWFRPLSASGTATLTVYMMPYLLYSINDVLGLYSYGALSGPLGLLKCAAFSFLCFGLASLLVRFRIKLKI